MRIASLPSRAWKRRIASFWAILAPGQPGAGGDAVRHRVRDQLRPALAPQIVGRLGAVGVRDEAQHLLRPLGDAAMHLAGAVDRVAAVLAADAAAMDMAGLDEADADVAGDAAEHLAPADDLGDRRLVHAVLQRDDIAARRQILPDQQRRPFGVVGFRADEGDVDRRLLGELLHLGQMQRAHLDRERLRALVVGDASARRRLISSTCSGQKSMKVTSSPACAICAPV